MATYSYTILFDPTPGSTGTLIEYRKSTESIWTVPSPDNPTTNNYYNVELDGDATTYYIRLSPVNTVSCSKKYDIETIVTPGETTSTTTTTTTTTLSPYTLDITNTLGGGIITDVTGFTYTILSGSFPIAPGGRVQGTHNTFSDDITITISGSPILGGNISIYKGVTLEDCIAVSGPGVYNSIVLSIGSADVLKIALNSGSC